MDNNSNYSLSAFPDMNQRGAFTIYCDDIRQEVAGKSTFVGVYGGEMIVPKFPAILPNFFIYTTVWTSRALPFRKIVLRTLMDEAILSQEEVDIARYDAMHQEIERGSESNDPMARRVLRSTARFSPLLIEKESVIRVRVETEDGELRSAGLRIKIAK